MAVMYVVNSELLINLDLIKAIIRPKEDLTIICFNGLEDLKEMVKFDTEEAAQKEFDNIIRALALNYNPKKTDIKIMKGGLDGKFKQ